MWDTQAKHHEYKNLSTYICWVVGGFYSPSEFQLGLIP